MNQLKTHLTKILALLSAILFTIICFGALKFNALQEEVSTLQNNLKEKTAQIAIMQNDLGKEVEARNSCETNTTDLKQELASVSQKLESFALQAAACEQLRRKLRK